MQDLKQTGRAEDVADVVAFLATDAASIPVDRGSKL
jgi:hypothetical protein